jgi:MFS family permease
MTTRSSGLRHGFSSLRHRDYALFWSAAIISNTGSWMQNVTVPFVVFAMTRSTTWLGVTAFASFFPTVAVGPLAGPIADRFPRRAVLLVTQTTQMAIAFSLWACWVTGRATPTVMVLHLLASGTAGGINIASWQSFVPSLVPPEDLLNAVRVNSIQFTVARAIGPAVAGLVLARFGAGVSFMVNAVTFLLVIGALLEVSPRPTPVSTGGRSFLGQFRDGIAYVRGRKSLRQCVVTITVLAALASALVQLAPAFASNQFHAGKAGYGLLVAGYGAGAIAGSLAMASYADGYRRSRAAVSGLLGASLFIGLLSLASHYALGLVAFFAVGVCYTAVSISLNTAIQDGVTEQYRGRVMSLYLMGLTGGLPIGALVLGRLAGVLGMPATAAAVSVVLFAYAALVIFRQDALSAIDHTVDERREAVAPGPASGQGVTAGPLAVPLEAD